jgi:hypothetical protein
MSITAWNQNQDWGFTYIVANPGNSRRPVMNQSVHQLLRLILEGFAWFLKTIEALWGWSWAQIVSAFSLSW